MPDNPTYIHQLAGILEEARTPKPIPFFRRRDIEALFGLKKRQAVNLMHRSAPSASAANSPSTSAASSAGSNSASPTPPPLLSSAGTTL